MLSTFYKLVFDVSVYFTFVSFLFRYIFQYETNAATFGVFLVSALLMAISERMQKGSRVIGILSLLIPALALSWENSSFGLLELILPWIYYVLLYMKSGYSMYHEEFVGRFRVLLWGLLLPVILYLFDVEKGEPAVAEFLPYLLVFLVCGVLSMQLLRFMEGAGNKKTFEQHQMKQTVVFFIFCALITVGNLLEILVEGIIEPLFMWLVGGLMSVLYFFTSKLTKKSIGEFTDKSDFQEYLEVATPLWNKNNFDYEVPEVWAQVQQAAMEAKPDFTLLFILAIIVVAVILFAVLLGRARKKKKTPLVDDEREELLDVEPPAKKPRRRSIHPDIVIRFHYLTFMKLVDAKKGLVSKSDTTAEIAEKYAMSCPQNTAQAQELTNIYRKARYSETAVTREDAARMKALLKEV